MEITSGVAQGSVVGPHLWNNLFDEVLSLNLPIGMYYWANADDKAIVVTVRTESNLIQKANIAIATVIQWQITNRTEENGGGPIDCQTEGRRCTGGCGSTSHLSKSGAKIFRNMDTD